jgi:hypothetical protein
MKDTDRTNYARRIVFAAADLDSLLPNALAKWREYRSDGFGAGTRGPQTRGSGIGDPTGARAVTGDPMDRKAKEWDDGLKRVALDVEWLVRVMRELTAGGPTRPRCANVACPDKGFAVDLARCKACAQYKRRKGKDRKP